MKFSLVKKVRIVSQKRYSASIIADAGDFTFSQTIKLLQCIGTAQNTKRYEGIYAYIGQIENDEPIEQAAKKMKNIPIMELFTRFSLFESERGDMIESFIHTFKSEKMPCIMIIDKVKK